MGLAALRIRNEAKHQVPPGLERVLEGETSLVARLCGGAAKLALDARRILFLRSEKLIDIETNFQAWRLHHVRTVERIIGFKAGTGGTTGVKFLKKTLEICFFPELSEVRTRIGAA